MSFVEGGETETGLSYMKDAVEIYKGINNNPGEYISSLNFYSSLLFKVGKISDALKSYNTLILLIKEHYGTNQPFYADAVSKLADCYSGLGNIEKAIPLKQKALNMIKKTLGTEHIFYSTCLSELGELYYNTEEYSKAAPLYSEALDVRTKILGLDNDECISYVQSLVSIYIAMGLNNKAEDILNYSINNLPVTSDGYGDLVLELVKFYMDTEDGAGLNKAFSLFNKAHPEKGFDEMLDMAEDIDL